ncbi:hypothetical protein [Tautonia plasticadhaerens]|uniref:SWIM-type domain-containing protein n=1 Tax=Tautonia plasticadhaerens TaxID=2527974 RepID=A0A518GZN7_9BACT|nr:hypothetical protein [Tautonia plasticadhaerens]QDV34055.1 hypothetical protein ElP_19360 [Tautonia plasticadhaerens]
MARPSQHPDLGPALAASALADVLGDAMARHLRRFDSVFRLDVQGAACTVHLVVGSDPNRAPSPTVLAWEVDEPRPDGLSQTFVVSARPGLCPRCSCAEYERDWDCRHIRALQDLGILGSPVDAETGPASPCDEWGGV